MAVSLEYGRSASFTGPLRLTDVERRKRRLLRKASLWQDIAY